MLQNTFNLFGAKIAEYAGNDVAIPNMHNGRCFPTALALCQCRLDMLSEWLRVPRNEVTSTPIRMHNLNKVTDTLRHDFELAFSKQSAQAIIEKLKKCPDVKQPVNAEILRRLENGHTTEEEDLRDIAIASGINLQILDLHHVPVLQIEVSPGLPTYKMILAGVPEQDHGVLQYREGTLHWEPVVTLPPFGLLLASRQCSAALGWNMKYNPIADIRCQVATTIRRVGKQRRQIHRLETHHRALEARLAALEQQVADAVPEAKPKPKGQVRKQRRRIAKLETDNRALEARLAALQQQVADAVPKAKPKRKIAASAFALYTAAVRRKLSGAAPAQAKQASAEWKQLSPSEKQVFKDKHEKAKRELQGYPEAD